MRDKDKDAFFQAAKNKFWILVRDTNKFSLDRMGDSRVVPKEIDCKAKTANNPNSKIKGLVVDPYTHPDAFEFKVEKLGDYRKYWDMLEFKSGKYKVDRDPRSEFNGCLMCNGKYIIADYDLYDIIDINQPHRNLALCADMHGMEHRVGANLWKVMKIVNTLIGIPMIQHGGEAQYTAHSDQKLHVIGPHGEYLPLENLEDIKRWYQFEFKGRLTLADSFPKPDKNSSSFVDNSNVIYIKAWKKANGR